MIVEIKGDLFTSNDNLCHCVSTDMVMVMGKGIAIEFKKRWGKPLGPINFDTVSDTDIYTLNSSISTNTKFSVGDIGIVQDGDRKIIYLVTKRFYYDKPTYKSISLCLEKVKQLRLKTLSMPKIGCGLDRLEWIKVSQIVESILNDTNIIVYYL